MQLRVVGGRVQLDGREAVGEGPLFDDLRRWARASEAVLRERDSEGAELVSHRGRQLAVRLAAVAGVAVDYLDPVTGIVESVPARSRPRRPPGDGEPTPWATGLTTAGFVAAVVALADVALGLALAESLGLLVIPVNLLVGAGLAPAVWLARRSPVWRWVALGVAGGIAAAWVALVVSLLRS